MPDVDVAILGGGCAGLSLGARLVGSGVSFQIIESRTSYHNDRTWSFWRTGSHPFENLIRQSWTRWSVAGPGGVVERKSSSMPYQTLEGAAFYTAMREKIARDTAGGLLLGATANQVATCREGMRVTTSVGELSAQSVIDTRPIERRPSIGQFFVGQEIATSRAVFDTETVQMMHFRNGYSNGVDFLYLLPFAPDRALLEVTSFAPTSPGQDIMQSWLNDEIERLNTDGYDVIRSEAGALPMDVNFRAAQQKGVVHCGLTGGAARPSTGYAFQRIQVQAQTLAAQLINGKKLMIPRDDTVLQVMDATFLRVLAAAPSRGPALFKSLFERVAPHRLERFLSGSTLLRDRLAVVAALPPRPFLLAAAGLR
ncbi:MAG: lycopene cyclase family protein [Pseudomonadota bacterium]